MALFTHNQLSQIPHWEYFYEEVFENTTVEMAGVYYVILDIDFVDWENNIFYLGISDEHLRGQIMPSTYTELHPCAGKGEWTVSETEYEKLYNELCLAKKALMQHTNNLALIKRLEKIDSFYMYSDSTELNV